MGNHNAFWERTDVKKYFNEKKTKKYLRVVLDMIPCYDIILYDNMILIYTTIRESILLMLLSKLK